MKCNIVLAVILACSFSSGSGAQTQTPARTPIVDPPSQAKTDVVRKVTVTGCLERDTAATSARRPTGDTTSRQAAEDYKLTRATLKDDASGRAEPDAQKPLQLVVKPAPGSKIDFGSRVGQTVAVTGTLEKADPSAGVPTVSVTAIEMIAAGCKGLG